MTLTWEDLEMGHSQWLNWLLNGGAAAHYEDMLWPAWRAEVAELGLREGITVYPFPWSEEARQDLAATTREAVPLERILTMHGDFCGRLGLDRPGEPAVVGRAPART